MQRSSGGGGWGDPLERDPERVRMDVLDGYIPFEAASEDYGVVLDRNTGLIDPDATGSLRKAKKGGNAAAMPVAMNPANQTIVEA
jgi:N-methylhydantoinase B